MRKYTIAVYAICKNESKFIKRWYDSIKEADVICVLDTGSTDDSWQILKSLPNVIIKQQIFNPWRFDDARNESLNMVPQNIDLCLCIDLDEVAQPGWRQAIEKVWQNDTTLGQYISNYSFDKQGNPETTLVNARLHNRHDYHWIYPIHEVLEFIGVKENIITIPNMVINHYPDLTKSRSQYLNLLELAVAEMPDNPRQKLLLMGEYYGYHKYDEVIKVGHEFLAYDRNKLYLYDISRAERDMGKAYLAKQYYEEAELWLLKAHQDTPDIREPLAELGYFYFEINDYQKSRKYLLKTLAIKERSTSSINEADAWGQKVYDYLSCACYHLQKYKEALTYCNKSLALDPNNQNTINNLNLIKTAINDWENK